MNSKITLQIFSGGFQSKTVCAQTVSKEAVSFEAIERKLMSVLPRLAVEKVIMGWSNTLSRNVYEKTAELLAKHNVEFFLWFPVFSETGLLKELNPLIDLHGSVIESNAINGEEDFSFCCPNHPANIEKILDIFEEEFACIPFDGIFLDKIRYPSFANCNGAGQGLRSVLSCFCPHCLTMYEDNNFNIAELKDALKQPVVAPLGMNAYQGNGIYQFDNPVMSDFFRLKALFITQSLKKICQYFRKKNYKIGFDVFAPFLSAFTGQDLPALSLLCDFIKPMMYRITNAPAGLPFETQILLQQTGCTDIEKRHNFDSFICAPSQENPFDLSFVVHELKDLAVRSACPVYAGVEINRKENIAPVYPDYIKETMEAYSTSGIEGLALSWDLLHAPDENVERAISTVKAKG